MLSCQLPSTMIPATAESRQWQTGIESNGQPDRLVRGSPSTFMKDVPVEKQVFTSKCLGALGSDRNPVQQRANRFRLQFQTSCSVLDYAMSRSASGTYLDHLTIKAGALPLFLTSWAGWGVLRWEVWCRSQWPLPGLPDSPAVMAWHPFPSRLSDDSGAFELKTTELTESCIPYRSMRSRGVYDGLSGRRRRWVRMCHVDEPGIRIRKRKLESIPRSKRLDRYTPLCYRSTLVLFDLKPTNPAESHGE